MSVLRTERERSGPKRSGYVPRSRSYVSNVRRKLRRVQAERDAKAKPKRAASTPREQYDEAHALARRGVRSTRVKRTSVYDQSQAYYRKTRGSKAGGFIEGFKGDTAVRTRRGGAGDQNKRTRSVANVKNKRTGRGPQRRRQSDQGDAGQ